MASPNRTQARERAHGNCRKRRRPEGARRVAWAREYLRALHALDATQRRINATSNAGARLERRARRRPVRTERQLWALINPLGHAWMRLMKAADHLVAMEEILAANPDPSGFGAICLASLSDQWARMSAWFNETAEEIHRLRDEVVAGLESGELVPEPPPVRRPRIVVAPRPVPLRAFLRRRQRRVVQRIGPLLRRRRRTPRPAALRVPARNVQGRAPPLSSFAAL